MRSVRTLLRHVISYWPPLLGAGIRVVRVSDDMLAVDVRLGFARLMRNGHGTQFGGSLFAMTDPFYPLMLQHHLGRDYIVWDQAASIEYVSPGRGPVTASFRLTEARIEEIRAAASGGAKTLPAFDVEILDKAGGVVARVKRVVYVRKKAK
jgi:acyl-coenzyme A thioesterase PaaI-like protein